MKKVELGIEVGTILEIEEDPSQDFLTQVEDKVIDEFNIDGVDKILNNIHIYDIR